MIKGMLEWLNVNARNEDHVFLIVVLFCLMWRNSIHMPCLRYKESPYMCRLSNCNKINVKDCTLRYHYQRYEPFPSFSGGNLLLCWLLLPDIAHIVVLLSWLVIFGDG
uniref:Uncharacterized protein n=1 Tax=Salix viminalis TaxID=40686 RepID=A0A6N2M639_SALVM